VREKRRSNAIGVARNLQPRGTRTERRVGMPFRCNLAAIVKPW
jgi:hypothetical protein